MMERRCLGEPAASLPAAESDSGPDLGSEGPGTGSESCAEEEGGAGFSYGMLLKEPRRFLPISRSSGKMLC